MVRTGAKSLLPRSSAAQALPLDLSWQAPPECPEREDVLARARALLGAKALRQAEWKYIVTRQPFSEELYDLKRDPRERVNLVTQQQKISARLRREASALWPEMFTTDGDGARDIQSASRD